MMFCTNHADVPAVATVAMPAPIKGTDGEYLEHRPFCEPCLGRIIIMAPRWPVTRLPEQRVDHAVRPYRRADGRVGCRSCPQGVVGTPRGWFHQAEVLDPEGADS